MTTKLGNASFQVFHTFTRSKLERPKYQQAVDNSLSVELITSLSQVVELWL